jgi:ammonium transporter, Amt family
LYEYIHESTNMARGNNFVPYQPYNSTLPTGGDPLTQDLNLYYESGDLAWILTSTALVLLMIPGVGFFYSGLARRKSALSLIWLSIMSVAVVWVQWFVWGYSLTFAHDSGKFIGTLSNAGFHNVLAQPSVASDKVPDLMFAVYQGMFASITLVSAQQVTIALVADKTSVALAIGAVSERGRLLPTVIFMFIWSTVVYDPIACWTWNPSGWVYNLGGLDFAGGTPVHISSGSAALAYSYILGKRTGYGTQKLNYRPHNVTHIVIGTVFLWVGWFGFNAGSALGANLRAVMAAVVTNLAACTGGITWCLLDYRLERKWSTVGFCSGVIAGLVAITPGSGYVPAWASLVFGFCAGMACNFATKLKYWLNADDALDIFAVHAVGGFVGNLLTGVFAADYIAALDGFSVIPGGWLNGHWIQLAYQAADSATGMAYSFVVTSLILICISLLGRLIPVLRLRVDEAEEDQGIDDVEIGEFAYDYVELVRDVKTPGGVGGDDDSDFEVESVLDRSHSRAAMVRRDKETSAGSYPMQTISTASPENMYRGSGSIRGIGMAQ